MVLDRAYIEKCWAFFRLSLGRFNSIQKVNLDLCHIFRYATDIPYDDDEALSTLRFTEAKHGNSFVKA